MNGISHVKTASVAIYARVSSEHQAQQATIDSQVAALRERVGADGFLLVDGDVYVDDGVSGTTLIRPALERLRDCVAEGKVDRLYVHSPDRLARKYAYQVLLMEEFQRCGVQTVFLCGPTSRSPEDELLVQVQGMIAEYERTRLLERCRRGKLFKARSGSVTVLSNAPYGYRYLPQSEEGSASYQVSLNEAGVVRTIFRSVVDEHLHPRAIARKLTEHGVPTPRGGEKWSPSTVFNILGNPAYMGKAKYMRRAVAERQQGRRPPCDRPPIPRRSRSSSRKRPPEEHITIPVPPVVSEEVFLAAQDQLQRNKKLCGRNARKEAYLLQGLTVCGRCGYAFCGRASTSKLKDGSTRVLAYYACGGHYGPAVGGCENRPIRADLLEVEVWKSVREVLEDPARVLDEWSSRTTADGTVAELRERHEKALEREASLDRSVSRLVDAYEAGVIELDDLTKRRVRLRTLGERAREETANAAARLKETIDLTEIVSTLEGFRGRLATGLDSADWQQKRRIVRCLVERIEILDNVVHVVFRVPNSDRQTKSPDDPVDPDGQSCRLCPQRLGACYASFHSPIVSGSPPARSGASQRIRCPANTL